MKKAILTLATLAIMGTSFQSHAVVGAATGGLAGVATALVGLGIGGFGTLTALGCAISSESCGGGIMLLGFILLDGENGREIQFKTIPHNDLLKMNLTEDEAIAFNQNTEELSEAFKVVSSELNNDSNAEDAKKLWEEQEFILGTDAINGARKVLSFQVENNK